LGSFKSTRGSLNVSSRVRRISIALGVLLALGLVVGVGAGDRLAGDDEDPTTTDAVATTQAEPDPHPLATGTTPKSVQLLVFERAYSECASTEVGLLASKYAVADKSEEGVAAVVGRAWASYFKAGQDAVQDGLDGCRQGQKDRSN
jgi:hypothetical protein